MAALDTIDKIAHQLLLHCPQAGKPLAAVWASNSWLELADNRDWSWRTRYGQFVIPNVYSTGTVSTSATDPTLIVGNGTAWTADMVGRQFKLGYSFGYDITQVIDGQNLRIAMPWGDVPQVAVSYAIVQQFVTVPDDFHHFLSVLDPTRNFRLRTGVERREIDLRDPRRVTTGIPYVVAEAGYSTIASGSIDSMPTLALGSVADPTPFMTGTYLGALGAVYIFEVTLGGASGTATYRWKRDNGTYVSGVLTSAGPLDLGDGASVYWPATTPSGAAATYILGDIFLFRATAASSMGLPRFEIWPNQTTQSIYPYYYVTQPPDLLESGASLPRSIPGRVILKGGLREAAGWPGRAGETGANPYYDMKNATRLGAEWMREMDIQAIRDDDIYPKDVSYFRELPFGGPPWDASWEQRHQ